ncbi:MAG: hypothetical protein AAF191_03440 [Verrucomicrobiota bacterium]
MDLEQHLLDVLQRKGGEQGLTHAELRQACGVGWRRHLAGQAGREGEAGVTEVRDFVHRLWQSGRVLIEPPSGKGQAVRIWHPDQYQGAAAMPPSGVLGEGGKGQILEAYAHLAKETRSPYIFISRLRDASGVDLSALHTFLTEEQEHGRAVLSTGDWSAATEPERSAVLEGGGRRFIKVRLL